MRPLPALATTLLLRLGPRDESFAGDLAEEYAAGRSRGWYWRQVLSAIVLTSTRQIAARPMRASAAVITGWATMLLVFFALGDRLAWGLAGWLWDWDRQRAYETGVWWPFSVAAVFVSYSGFVLSALAVVRVHRRQAGPMLVAYAASMFVALIASAVTIEVLSRLWDNRVPVPHTLFYVVSVALPYHWRTGLLLAPTVILIAGLLGAPRPVRPSVAS
jgi:hypothetical protein